MSKIVIQGALASRVPHRWDTERSRNAQIFGSQTRKHYRMYENVCQAVMAPKQFAGVLEVADNLIAQRLVQTLSYAQSTIWRRVCERRDCALPQLLAVDGFLGCPPGGDVSPHLVLGTTSDQMRSTNCHARRPEAWQKPLLIGSFAALHANDQRMLRNCFCETWKVRSA